MDDRSSVDEDGVVTIDVVANDGDLDGDPLRVVGASPATNGTVTVTGAGEVTYRPSPNFNGADEFTYTVEDPSGGRDSARVTVDVRSVDDAPVAAGDTVSTHEDEVVTIAALANDSDPDGDQVTIVAVSAPENGIAAVVGGEVEYSPDPDFNGTDRFTYTIDDGAGGRDFGEIVVDVAPVNDRPTAVDDHARVAKNREVRVAVLANDCDVDGDRLVVSGTGRAANGKVTVLSDQSVLYKPRKHFVGTDSFAYAVSDGRGGTSTAVVLVTVG